MQLAQQEAKRLHHEYIGTEHILLGLLDENYGVAANVLKNMGLSLKQLRDEIESVIKNGPEIVTCGKLPQTPKAKLAIEYAMEESRNLTHNYVGTEHLLLGLLRVTDGVAAVVLKNLGVKLEAARTTVIDLIGPRDSDDASIPVKLSLDISLVTPILDAVMRGKWARVVDGKLETKDA